MGSPLRVGFVAVIGLAACGKVSSIVPDAHPDAQALPVLASVMPPSGIVSTIVTLTGSNFGATTGTVAIDGMSATIATWSDTSITATVPTSVLPGSVPVVVTAGGGSSGSQPFRVVLPPAAYLNNDLNAGDGFDSVTQLTFDPSTGALTQGATVSLGVAASSFGGCSTSAVLHEHTRRLFASGGTAVAVFDIDPMTGALTAVAGSPFTTGSDRGFGLVVNKAGTRLWVTDYDAKLAVFNIASDGVLTPVSGSPFTVPADTDMSALSLDETALTMNTENGTLLGYTIDSNGTPTAVAGSPFTLPSGEFGMAARPGFDQIFLGVSPSMYVAQVAGGVPTQIPGSPFPFTVPAGELHYPAFTADGSHVYFSCYGSGSIQGFSLDATGVPTQLNGSPWNFAPNIAALSCLAVSRDGSFLVGVDEGHKHVGVFAIDGNGALAPVPNSPFTQTTPNESASGLAITF